MLNKTIESENLSQFQEMPKPLEPFKYPKWVLAILLGICICFIYSVPIIPKLYRATSSLYKGDILRKNGNFDEAANYYIQTLKTFPDSTTARINYAMCVFSNKTSEDDEYGLAALEGVSLNSERWQMISSVMPEDFKQYFKTEGEQ